MQKFKLKNGMSVLYQEKDSNSVALQIVVQAGSNDENKNEQGIAHFIEHMVFMGTKKRTPQKIVSDIENVGGEFNAVTTNDFTYYYVVVPKKYFDIALEVLSDMLLNPTFDEKYIDQERNVIFDEIDMVNDDPKNYQWIMLEDSLFKSFPGKYPVYGSKETLKNVGKKELFNFYKRYYVPGNMIISAAGKVNGLKQKLEAKFKNFSGKISFTRPKFLEKDLEKNLIAKKFMQTEQCYLTIGFRGVGRKEKDNYTLDILERILGKGQSSRLFNEIRVKRGLAYAVAAYNNCHRDYGYFAISLATSKKNVEKCKKLVFRELELKKLSKKDISEAKRSIEGDYLLRTEGTKDAAETNSYWAMAGRNSADYLRNIRKITLKDVKNASKRYFYKKYAMVLIEQKP